MRGLALLLLFLMSIQSNVTAISGVTPGSGQSLEAAENRGLAWAWLGMLGFSLTLTATRAAVAEMSGLFVGFGRAVVAAVLAAVVLAARGDPLPLPGCRLEHHAWPPRGWESDPLAEEMMDQC